MNHFKKTNKKLDRLRGIFFQLGLVIACGLTLVAFEWKIETHTILPPVPRDIDGGEIDVPPITFQEAPEKPKVKIQPLTPNNDVLEIIDDNVTDVDPTPEVDLDVLPEFIPDNVEPTSPPEEKPPFIIVEKMPEFVGGDVERKKYLKKNIKYPTMDRIAKIEGTVYFKFLVNKKGEIKNVKIIRGVNQSIDKEAMRVVKAMPNWSPGKQRGRAVNVSLTMQIKFELR